MCVPSIPCRYVVGTADSSKWNAYHQEQRASPPRSEPLGYPETHCPGSPLVICLSREALGVVYECDGTREFSGALTKDVSAMNEGSNRQ
jgi:hypothetical protein